MIYSQVIIYNDIYAEDKSLETAIYGSKPLLLLSRIKLRSSVISFFMLGALFGAYLFKYISFEAFLFPVFIQTFTLFYDVFRVNIKRYYSNFRYRKKAPFKPFLNN